MWRSITIFPRFNSLLSPKAREHLVVNIYVGVLSCVGLIGAKYMINKTTYFPHSDKCYVLETLVHH